MILWKDLFQFFARSSKCNHVSRYNKATYLFGQPLFSNASSIYFLIFFFASSHSYCYCDNISDLLRIYLYQLGINNVPSYFSKSIRANTSIRHCVLPRTTISVLATNNDHCNFIVDCDVVTITVERWAAQDFGYLYYGFRYMNNSISKKKTHVRANSS